jgi:hypothetical protein
VVRWSCSGCVDQHAGADIGLDGTQQRAAGQLGVLEPVTIAG